MLTFVLLTESLKKYLYGRGNMETRIKNILVSKQNRNNDSSILLGIVNQNGRQIYSVGIDDKSNIPVEDRIFEIGSISKVFTAVFLQTMIRDNIVQLDDSVLKYQPSYIRAFSNNRKEITLRDLITHQSNLPRDASNIKVQDRMNPFASYQAKDLDQFLSNFQLKKYKNKWKYSNVGVGFLGNLLASVLGTEYEEAINARICKPLDLHNTFINISDNNQRRVIKTYMKNKEIPPFSIPALPGAGGLKSTLNDMLTFIEGNLRLTDNPLQQVFNQTHKIQNNIRVDNNTHMGLGWMISKDKQTQDYIHWHTGGTVGFNTYIGMKKEKKMGIIIATTQKHSMWKLVKILLGLGETIGEDIAFEVYNYLLSTE